MAIEFIHVFYKIIIRFLFNEVTEPRTDNKQLYVSGQMLSLLMIAVTCIMLKESGPLDLMILYTFSSCNGTNWEILCV